MNLFVKRCDGCGAEFELPHYKTIIPRDKIEPSTYCAFCYAEYLFRVKE